MQTPAGQECRYFYGDYYRGRNHEECRLIAATSPSTNWTTFVLFQESPSPNNVQEVTSGNSNATIRICAETFDKPNGIPLEGATIVLTAERFLPMQPPQLVNLQLYDTINESAVSSVLTGPRGCVAVKVGPGDLVSWPSGQTTWLQGTATYGSQTENVWGGGVWRSG